MLKEKEFEDGCFKGVEEDKNESDLKTWMRLFKKKININENDAPYPDLGKVTQKTVKRLFTGHPYLKSFIQFLKNNDKISNN